MKRTFKRKKRIRYSMYSRLGKYKTWTYNVDLAVLWIMNDNNIKVDGKMYSKHNLKWSIKRKV